MKKWERNGYTVVESLTWDKNINEFVVHDDGEIIGIVKPKTIDQQKFIIEELDGNRM